MLKFKKLKLIIEIKKNKSDSYFSTTKLSTFNVDSSKTPAKAYGVIFTKINTIKNIEIITRNFI